MKKTYKKPEIVFESFVLSTNIAGDCEVRATTKANYNSCAHEYADMFLFGTDLGGCKKFGDSGRLIPPNQGLYDDSYCYHVPSVGSNIFNS